ncbi:unnamed protein product [Caenorhabditis angaria]|uniref:Uncharacterized protein n=1 Tax=Caenorhabditis angaria TaxID=860376 RepID=A0A9P1MTC1_9PELO|nr:unnamed protein product [Caenorhabditis angaria]
MVNIAIRNDTLAMVYTWVKDEKNAKYFPFQKIFKKKIMQSIEKGLPADLINRERMITSAAGICIASMTRSFDNLRNRQTEEKLDTAMYEAAKKIAAKNRKS